MKPIKLILATAIGAAMLSSCGDSSYEVHQTMFYPNNGAVRLYADQVQDTIHVYSLDSWTGQASFSNGGTWFTFSPQRVEVEAGKASDTKITITASGVNTTGKNLAGELRINSHDQIATNVYHYAWLEVTSPAAQFVDKNGAPINTSQMTMEEFEKTFPTFAIKDIAATATDTAVSFRTYQPGAKLTSDAAWLKLDGTDGNYPASGKQRAALKVEANTTGADRTANLTLTSAGISTIITLTQKAAK